MLKSVPKPVNEAAKDYEAWYEEQVRLGLDDLDAGRVVSSAEAEKHFERTLKQLSLVRFGNHRVDY
jgi:predicted transcriptional regulator